MTLTATLRELRAERDVRAERRAGGGLAGLLGRHPAVLRRAAFCLACGLAVLSAVAAREAPWYALMAGMVAGTGYGLFAVAVWARFLLPSARRTWTWLCRPASAPFDRRELDFVGLDDPAAAPGEAALRERRPQPVV